MGKLAQEADEVVPIPVALDRVAVQVAVVGIAVDVKHVAVRNGAAYKYTK